MGLLATDGPRLGALSLELPGAIGERCTDEASAKSVPWHPAPVELDESERTRGDSAMSDVSQTNLPEPGQKLSISSSPPRGEASIPRASAPASTGCLLPYWDAQEYELLSSRVTCPGTTQGSGVPACIRGANADLPDGWYKRPPLCCRCAPTHGDLLGLEESVWVLEKRPASPDSWCATWDGGHSTDRGQGGPSRSLPNQSGMRPLLALRGDNKLPAPGLRQEQRFSPHV